jgi:hypothetical protein
LFLKFTHQLNHLRKGLDSATMKTLNSPLENVYD